MHSLLPLIQGEELHLGTANSFQEHAPQPALAAMAPIGTAWRTTWRTESGRTKLVLLALATAWKRVKLAAARPPPVRPQQQWRKRRALLADAASGVPVAACTGRTGRRPPREQSAAHGYRSYHHMPQGGCRPCSGRKQPWTGAPDLLWPERYKVAETIVHVPVLYLYSDE